MTLARGNIGQVTIDLGGGLTFIKDLCGKLGLARGEKLIVARKRNGKLALIALLVLASVQRSQLEALVSARPLSAQIIVP